MNTTCLPDVYAVTVFWCAINCFSFYCHEIGGKGKYHNLDMWQRPQPIEWRDIKKSLERQESSGNAFIWATLVSWPMLFVYEWHLAYLADMTWIKCCHMCGFMSSMIFLAPGQSTHTYFTSTYSFLLPLFFSGIYKHMDTRVTESKVKNVLFYNKDPRCDRSIMRACVWGPCGTFCSWTAWKVIGLGSEKREKERIVDKRDLFRQVGLVSWTVRNPSWLSVPQPQWMCKEKCNEEGGRVSVICFHSRTAVCMEMKRESTGREVVLGGCSSSVLTFAKHEWISTPNPNLTKASCTKLSHMI